MKPSLRLLLCLGLALPLLVSSPAPAQFIPAPLGNVFPEAMTHDDLTALSTAAAKLYTPETATVGATERWSNPKTGNSGIVTLTRQFEHKGMPCRRIEHKVKFGASEQTYAMNRCRVATGEWKLLA